MFQSQDVFWLGLVGLVWLTLLWRVVAGDLRRRREAFVSSEMFRRIVGHTPTRRPVVKWGLMVAAFFLLVLALARPVGGVVEEEVMGMGMDVVVALDVSTSMNALDIEGNARLGVAKAVLARMMEGLRQDRVGLIIFAGETMVQSPLSHDRNAFLTFLERVDPSLLTKQGTNLAGAIETALDRFDMTASTSRVIILVSDGEDRNTEGVARAIAEAARKSVPVFTIGIGSEKGAFIPEGRNVWGDLIYKTWQGKRVVSKLDDALLKRIAHETKGRFFRTTDIQSARDVASALEGLKRIAVSSGTRLVTRELYFFPALLAFFLLLFEWAISERIPFDREHDHWVKRL